MLKYYYKSLRTDSLRELDDYKRGTWVYAEAPTENELETLTTLFKLELGHLQDALDEDEQPRLERENGQSYIFVRFAYKRPGGEIDTAPLLIIFGGDYVITIAPIHVPMLEMFLSGRIEFATTQRAKFVLQLLSLMSDQYDVFINQTSRQVKAVRSRLRGRKITNKELVDFVTIEDELNEFLASLEPTNAALRRLLVGKHMPLYEADQDLVEDLLLNNDQSIEACRSNLRSISNIRDAYSAIASNNLNQTLTILTIATILISVPSLAMGIYSLNIPLPFQHSSNTFWIVMVINITLMATVVIVARKKRII